MSTSTELVFKKELPYPRYQVRFWSTPQQYHDFKARVEADGLSISQVFNQFMRWFITRPKDSG